MKALLIAVAAALTACAAAPSAAQQAPPHSMPGWWLAHVDFMSRDGGVWIAPNPANAEDEANQPDAFGMHWRADNNNHVLVGRLYGIEHGRRTQQFWSFREFWHPGERRAILEQWGGAGIYAVGETRMDGNRGVVEQTFWLPDGRAWKEGHRTVEGGDVYLTEQFSIDQAGVWCPNGSYTWRRARDEQGAPEQPTR